MVKILDYRVFFLVLPLLLISTDLAILLNIPFLRQVFGFLFLTFLPGLLILHILKLNKIGSTEKIVLSVGLSISFVMLFGWLINNLSLGLGYETPLSTISLLISFNIVFIVLAIIGYKINFLGKNLVTPLYSVSTPLRSVVKHSIFASLNQIIKTWLNLTSSEKVFLIVPILFPALSIFGMHVMNTTDSNTILMFLLFLIPIYVAFVCFFNRKFPKRLYPAVIFLISISLLLLISLRSNHIIGSDTHATYYLFQVTLDNLHWSVVSPSTLDACLSISLLPSIYQIFLNINPEYIFKVLYSLLFSISPLIVYIISKKYIGNFYAFLASFFFMSQFYFFWTTGSARTNMAILFFALAIMVLFHDGISAFAKRLLFIVFAVSCIVSHYATTYVFLFVLLLTWIGMQIIPRIILRERRGATSSENSITGDVPSKSSPMVATFRNDIDALQSAALGIPRTPLKGGVTITIVALFFAMLFFWYSQVTVASFSAGVDVIHKTFANLNQWFVIEARGPEILAAGGKSALSTIPQKINFVFSWLTIAFIAIGVLSTVAMYKRLVAIPDQEHIKPNFLYSKFGMEYFVLSLVCSAILVFSVVVPYISVGYSMSRIYFQVMAVLAPFFVIGGIMVARWLRARPHWIILVVLIPFFMCTTSTMYQIFDVPTSLALNSEGLEYELWYVHDQESYAAKWIKKYGKERILIYTGAWPGPRILHSQGKIPYWQTMHSFISQYQEGRRIDGYIYLRHTDITVGRVVTEYPVLFARKSKIYTPGGSEVYR